MSRRVAIVDFGLGNLFSVQQACAAVELDASITSSPGEVARADGIILPGVGAFADAMTALRDAGLDVVLREASENGTLVIGICLGMQLLCTTSDEFGSHRGLALIDGRVRRLPHGIRDRLGRTAKVPEVGWNAIREAASWAGTPLDGTRDLAQFYFVHSFYVEPSDPGCVLSTTTYGTATYCSSVARGNIFGFQFHPERSGPTGLRVYRNIRRLLEQRRLAR